MKRILVIDDEPNILKSLMRILDDNYAVTTALGGGAGLKLLKNGDQFDLIISDLSMPEINGIELYNQIAILFPGLEKNIIFMTGFAYTEDIKTFLQNVNPPILEKPFIAENLFSLINKHFLSE